MQISITNSYADHLLKLWIDAIDDEHDIERLRDLWPVVLQLPAITTPSGKATFCREQMLWGIGRHVENRLDRLDALLDAGYPFSWDEMLTVAKNTWPGWCLGFLSSAYDEAWFSRAMGLLERLLDNHPYAMDTVRVQQVLDSSLKDPIIIAIALRQPLPVALPLLKSVNSFQRLYEAQVHYLAGLLDNGWHSMGYDRLLEQVEQFLSGFPDKLGFVGNVLRDAVAKSSLSWENLYAFCAFASRGYQTADSRLSGQLRQDNLRWLELQSELGHCECIEHLALPALLAA